MSPAGSIGGGLWEIHSSDAIALIRPVEVAVADRQAVAFAQLSIYARQEIGAALWIGKILAKLPSAQLGVYDRLLVILLLAGADLECGLLAIPQGPGEIAIEKREMLRRPGLCESISRVEPVVAE